MSGHEVHLRRAITLAAQARQHGDPPFGSVLVSAAGTVLAEARNTTATDRDVTAHPELALARWAGRELGAADAATTTLYTSCQPCPMCTGAIARARIGRVVFALSTEQLRALQPADLVPPDATAVELVGPLLADEARGPVRGSYG